ncbi:hypothetical protein [Tenacibaculum maritimum]|uniref:hypothetical protein n=1 Tax=Tenacibaculum maritimum TaxID=107401 RepID=UPI00388D2314
MAFDKTELLEHKRKLVSSLKNITNEIELLDEQLDDYIQYLGDEEKERALEKWEEKKGDLFELSESIVTWLSNSQSIK